MLGVQLLEVVLHKVLSPLVEIYSELVLTCELLSIRTIRSNTRRRAAIKLFVELLQSGTHHHGMDV